MILILNSTGSALSDSGRGHSAEKNKKPDLKICQKAAFETGEFTRGTTQIALSRHSSDSIKSRTANAVPADRP